ncbi:MAG: hypothetical protein JJU21_03380 [Salinarimonas sp.]|nr:hypothetical protein [Salinarimonas sp.]
MTGAIEALAGSMIERGDLAHIALFAWASVASLFAAAQHREAAAASRRFDDFVRELAIFNRRHSGDCE